MDKLDLVGRTSEMARLFGIDFSACFQEGPSIASRPSCSGSSKTSLLIAEVAFAVEGSAVSPPDQRMKDARKHQAYRSVEHWSPEVTTRVHWYKDGLSLIYIYIYSPMPA